jgi:hypothetical protein
MATAEQEKDRTKEGSALFLPYNKPRSIERQRHVTVDAAPRLGASKQAPSYARGCAKSRLWHRAGSLVPQPGRQRDARPLMVNH